MPRRVSNIQGLEQAVGCLCGKGFSSLVLEFSHHLVGRLRHGQHPLPADNLIQLVSEGVLKYYADLVDQDHSSHAPEVSRLGEVTTQSYAQGLGIIQNIAANEREEHIHRRYNLSVCGFSAGVLKEANAIYRLKLIGIIHSDIVILFPNT